MTFDSKGEFPEQDRLMLELNSKSEWVPPDPAKLISPYIEKEIPGQESDLEKRLRKTKEVIDGYGKIIEQCRTIRAQLDARCSTVKITIDPIKNKSVLDAARRFFKRDVKEITYDMYKEVVHAMAAATNENTPHVGGVNGSSQ